ncbi:MAG: hypothetical protein GY717_10570 [Rhodobacteraceae bacterium]|nr:hypothetical protein [Paracoccaceae bacterium]
MCLTIPYQYHRFPDWDGRLPALPAGVNILRAGDLGPATKLQAVFQRFARDDIVIVDDDCDYGPGWLDAFRAARRAHPQSVIAASSFDSSRLGLPEGHPIIQGFAGVMLRPEWLGVPLSEPGEPVMWVDDIWLSALIARRRLDVVDCPSARAAVSAGSAPDPLQKARICGLSRGALNRIVAVELQNRFGVWQGPAPGDRPGHIG